MKKLLLCFFTIMFFAPSAFAADGAVSRAIPAGTSVSDTSAAAMRVGTTVSRVAKTNTTETPSTGTASAVRGTVSRVFAGSSTSGSAASATRGNVVSRVGVSAARTNLNNAVNTVGRNSRVSDASINNNPTVRRAGVVLRPSTAEVGGRATIGDTGVQTGSNIDEAVRNIGSRAAKTITAESLAEATERLEQTAALNKSCQEQYNECMDQFCKVVDVNQGRCSCSSNLSRYTKVEDAVKDANTQLNEVAQRIRYVGLSADEIRAIMNATEAEEALSGTKDVSETRNMLEEIEELIRNPVAGSSSYSSGAYADLDIDLDFSADSGDLFSLDFLDVNTTGNFSNLRGSELYNAAKGRCNSVLKQCKSAGATVTQITGNYDLAIDKDCVAYEQGLTKMNETLVSNVRSANRMLQKARLAVLQNKNQYDAKGCIGALETCMKDDMVCGEDYFKCVDPTKMYIDENGEVVLGQNISQILDFMKDYNNAEINADSLQDLGSLSITPENCKESKPGANGKCIVKYLLTKIGTGQEVVENGLCRAVLEKCQSYTYESNAANAKYKPYNDIVVNYIQRAMVNIRAAQQNIISKYASSCMVDVADCYNKQVTQVNSWSSSANVKSVAMVMRGACKNVALTCAYAIDSGCAKSTDEATGEATDEDTNKCIEMVSEMFYQSLLCPENSQYQATSKTKATEGGDLYVNEYCKCVTGYEPYGNACLVACDTDNNMTRNAYGTCVCKTRYKLVNGTCIFECPSDAKANEDNTSCVCTDDTKEWDPNTWKCVDTNS